MFGVVAPTVVVCKRVDAFLCGEALVSLLLECCAYCVSISIDGDKPNKLQPTARRQDLERS